MDRKGRGTAELEGRKPGLGLKLGAQGWLQAESGESYWGHPEAECGWLSRGCATPSTCLLACPGLLSPLGVHHPCPYSHLCCPELHSGPLPTPAQADVPLKPPLVP